MSDISESQGGWDKEGSEVAKSLSPSFSFLLLALGYGFRKQRRRKRRRRRRSWMEANGQVNPKRPLSLHIYLPRGAHPPPRPKSTAFSAVDFAITDGWAPRPRSLPRARSNKCGTVTGGCGATVALSHPSAAAHAASSARGCRLKGRAHTVPHKLGHAARYRRKTRAHAWLRTLRCFQITTEYSSMGSLYPRRNRISRPY